MTGYCSFLDGEEEDLYNGHIKPCSTQEQMFIYSINFGGLPSEVAYGIMQFHQIYSQQRKSEKEQKEEEEQQEQSKKNYSFCIKQVRLWDYEALRDFSWYWRIMHFGSNPLKIH